MNTGATIQMETIDESNMCAGVDNLPGDWVTVNPKAGLFPGPKSGFLFLQLVPTRILL